MAEHRDPFCEGPLYLPILLLGLQRAAAFSTGRERVTILRERNRRFSRKAAFESDFCGLWETTGNGDDPYIISTRNKQHNNNKQTHKHHSRSPRRTAKQKQTRVPNATTDLIYIANE
jgi:hypothetical protein